MRPLLVFACVLLAIGCSKKPADDEPSGGSVGSLPTNRTGSASADSRVTGWFGVGEACKVGDVEVTIQSVELRKVPLSSRSFEGKKRLEESKEVELMVWVSIANVSKNKKLEYRRWSAGMLGGDHSGVTLIDEHKNTYRLQDHSSYNAGVAGPDGERLYGSETIYPGGKPYVDVLCFQRPVEAANELRLTLPSLARTEGGRKEGAHKFQIPSSAWK